MQINLFQERAEVEIGEALRSLELQPSFVVRGEREPYLYAEISEPNLKLYVYLDGLEFNVDGESAPFEHQDFESLDELLESFNRELLKRLRQRSESPHLS